MTRVQRILMTMTAVAALAGPLRAQMMGMIPGLTGAAGTPAFNLTAREVWITTPEGGTLFMWSYSETGQAAQYPGPTLIVNEGDAVTVVLTNNLQVATSIVFPGMANVQGAGTGPDGLLTKEAAPGGTVTYTFTASRPGTFIYYSGTRADLQIEMGLVGAIIVRPTAGMMQAYNTADTMFDREVLFLETEADPVIHELVAEGKLGQVDMNKRFPTYWFLNGRAGMDAMAPYQDPSLPAQPYDCMPMIHPGERLLLRVLSAGSERHPLHTHGNNFTIVGRDGFLLSTTGTSADLGESNFTTSVIPGGTEDAIYFWTGAGLGWDVYGHVADVDNPPLVGVGGAAGPEDVDYNGNGIIDALPAAQPGEDPADHGKPLPVLMPDNKALTFGFMWSGSPFLGTMGALPPGEGGFNETAGFSFMWHSHTEKELTNNNVFPGGMMTMAVIVPPGVAIP